ncbi:hypothetical protein J2T02_005698, partial [Chitinophaga terrae (ex Kim and Jung 2007)]|nr:hypothetical protein [Chitinophaga terrae (ex Kim and Jung 2007)]
MLELYFLNRVQCLVVCTPIFKLFRCECLYQSQTADLAAETPFNANFYNNDLRQLKERENSDQDPLRPQAYLNYILFDDQFKLVEESSGVKQVKNEPDQLQTLSSDQMVVKKSGFLYV